jgi:hypothetical protein
VRYKGCMAKIVPNHSAFRKRNRFGTVTSALPLFEIAGMFVRLDHVASFIVNANHGVMGPAVEFRVVDCVWLAKFSKWRRVEVEAKSENDYANETTKS